MKKGVRNVIDGIAVDVVLQAQREGGSELGPRVPVVFAGRRDDVSERSRTRA